MQDSTTTSSRMLQLVSELRVVAERCAEMIVEQQRSEARTVYEIAEKFEELISKVRESRLQELDAYLKCGSPISILRLIGQDHLEKPFNRILKWCADERMEHGFGRKFLEKLCKRLGFTEMLGDLATCTEVELWGEAAFDSSGDQPDLVVRTPNAALMLENKVGSGESGDGQYERYLNAFARFKAERASKSVFSSPKGWETPKNWDTLTHGDIALVLREVANDKDVSIWGRIIAIECAEALNTIEENNVAELLRATKHRGRETILDWHTILYFRKTSHLDNPWS